MIALYFVYITFLATTIEVYEGISIKKEKREVHYDPETKKASERAEARAPIERATCHGILARLKIDDKN